MDSGKRRTDQVRRAVADLTANQVADGFLPGDVNRILREQNEPMGAWEVRAELSALERGGEIRLDTARGRWIRLSLAQSA